MAGFWDDLKDEEFFKKAEADLTICRYYEDKKGVVQDSWKTPIHEFGSWGFKNLPWKTATPVEKAGLIFALPCKWVYEMGSFGLKNILDPLTYGNIAHSVINSAGFYANLMLKEIGSACKYVGNKLQSPLKDAQESSSMPWKVFCYTIGVPLFAIGAGLKMAGSGLDQLGSVVQTTTNLFANLVRAPCNLCSPFSEEKTTRILAQAGIAFSKMLTTEITSMVTEPLKSLAASIKTLGNALKDSVREDFDTGYPKLDKFLNKVVVNSISGLGTVMHGVGNVINGSSVLTDGVVGAVRKLLVGHPIEAMETFFGGIKGFIDNTVTRDLMPLKIETNGSINPLKWNYLNPEFGKDLNTIIGTSGKTESYTKAIINPTVELSKLGKKTDFIPTTSTYSPTTTPNDVKQMVAKDLVSRV